MTDAAAKWDREHANEVAHHVIRDGKFLPKNRPCDWCGSVVKVGWIHQRCAEQERTQILDAIY